MESDSTLVDEVDLSSLDLTDYVNPEDIYVIAGLLKTESGDLLPQTFLIIEYVDEDDQSCSLKVAFNDWQAIRVGLLMGSIAVKSTENFMEASAILAAREAEEDEAEFPQLGTGYERPSPYM